ncbi:MAG: formimidoylglutamase [Flavobacteriaceae bacterium]
MSIDFLTPIEDSVLGVTSLMPKQVIGKSIQIHTEKQGFPDLKNIRIALIGVQESRNSHYPVSDYDIDAFRREFYQLFPGNWSVKIADLGNLPSGDTPEDTYYALKEIVSYLREINVLPVIIGGSQDLTVSLYRSYEKASQWVNIVSVDNRFDFSQEEELISGRSYMSEIIMENPSKLYNFTNLGYQSYLIAQEELDLMDKLFFEAFRLGDVLDRAPNTEPVFREADIASFDMKVLNAVASGTFPQGMPNGIDGRTICALSRYAGISDRISMIGFFDLPNTIIFHKLMAQMVWYFVEGVQCRFDEYPVATSYGFIRYAVQMSDRELVFHKSNKSQRWWIELQKENYLDNKTKTNTLLSCTHQDYLDACNDILPDRWWRATKRN